MVPAGGYSGSEIEDDVSEQPIGCFDGAATTGKVPSCITHIHCMGFDGSNHYWVQFLAASDGFVFTLGGQMRPDDKHKWQFKKGYLVKINARAPPNARCTLFHRHGFQAIMYRERLGSGS